MASKRARRVCTCKHYGMHVLSQEPGRAGQDFLEGVSQAGPPPPPTNRVCIPVPLYHCFGMVIGNMACIASGAAMVYPAGEAEHG